MKKQIKKARVQKLRLHRETLERLDPRQHDGRLILGGTISVPPAAHCPISQDPPFGGC